MTNRQRITDILDTMNPQDALDLINSILKERKKANARKIYAGGIKNVIDAERPDLELLKSTGNGRK